MTVTLDELNDKHHEKTFTLSKLREAVNNGASPEDIFKACQEYATASDEFKEISDKFVKQKLDSFHKANVEAL